MKENTHLTHQRQAFLLTFFALPHHYEVKEVNGFILVRQINNNLLPPVWQVAIYSKDSYRSLVEKNAGHSTLFSALGAEPEAKPDTTPPLT